MDLGVIALILSAALLGPALSLATRGAVPAIVGTLVAGVALGKTGFRAFDPEKSDLSLLYTLGFATLMFTVGMHVPLRDKRLRGALPRGLMAVAAAVPLALAAGLAAHAATGGPALVYAVVIGSSSAAVALPIIDETGLSGSAVFAALAWITAGDILATLAIPLVITPSRAGHAAIGTVIVAVLVLGVRLAVRRLRGRHSVDRIRKEGKKRGWAIDLRFALVVLVTLGFIAQKVGSTLLVASFGTGLVVGWAGGPKRLSQEVLGLAQGFLVPLFFVMLGAKLELRALGSGGEAVGLALLLVAFAVGVHLIACAAIRAPLAIGLLADAQIGVPAAVIALGLPAHAIDQGQAAAIFCAALASIAAASIGAAVLRRGQQQAKARPHAAAQTAAGTGGRARV
ncbi:MAG TPA: cation:proton antiporter [Solirubrobacteraceae bacterium]|jgi:Kef-type K+ transport system membrane component KefB|nr:cation:proton antiporter [Solirubrobacteraceae bacterium]